MLKRMWCSRRWSMVMLLLALPLGGCALFSASSLWWIVLLLLGSAVALASGPTRETRRARAPADLQQRSSSGAPQAAEQLGKCSGWVHKSCGTNNKIVGSCCPKGARCNYRYSPYADCGAGTCVAGTTDRAMCPHPKSKHKTEKACQAKRGIWKQTCQAGKLGMECLPGMPTNYAGPLSRLYPQLTFVRCAKAPDPACVPGTSKAKCTTPKGKGKRR